MATVPIRQRWRGTVHGCEVAVQTSSTEVAQGPQESVHPPQGSTRSFINLFADRTLAVPPPQRYTAEVHAYIYQKAHTGIVTAALFTSGHISTVFRMDQHIVLYSHGTLDCKEKE